MNFADNVFHVGTFRHCEFTKDDVQRLQLVGDRIGSAIEPFVTDIVETSQSK